MPDRILKIVRSPAKGKKYRAVIRRDGGLVSVDFGAKGYEQFRDSTGLGLYSKSDHGDRARRRDYFSRHSGVPTKTEAMKVENRRSPGVWTAKKLSHRFLW